MRSKDHPYHVTARCNNKEHFPIPIYDVWSVISAELSEAVKRFGCGIHAFVLMPNHFHLLISTPKSDLGVVMQYFMLAITKRINAISGRSGRIFGSRYHASLIDHDHYYDCALKYVYRNPVKARLSESVQSYPFSTIVFICKKRFSEIPMIPPQGHLELIPDGNKDDFLEWLNLPFPNEQESMIKKGFKKTRFNPPKSGWKQGRVEIEGYRKSHQNNAPSIGK